MLGTSNLGSWNGHWLYLWWWRGDSPRSQCSLEHPIHPIQSAGQLQCSALNPPIFPGEVHLFCESWIFHAETTMFDSWMVPFGWWNVAPFPAPSPASCRCRCQEKVPKRRVTMWRAGKSHLQHLGATIAARSGHRKWRLITHVFLGCYNWATMWWT